MSVETQTPARTFDPVSISPLSFWGDTAEGREKSFKILRDERPVSWHAPIEGALMEAEIDGVWAVTRHEDIGYVSKHPDLFCSSQGVMIEAVPDDILDAAQSFLAMDGTKHATLRRSPRSATRSSGRPPPSSTSCSRPRKVTSSSRCPNACPCGPSTK
jgi:cytochrome P450